MRPSLRCLVLVLILATALIGQVNFAAIAGQIHDPNGGSVANATLTLVSPDTGFRRTTRSNQDGMYEFVGLNPGTYRLEIAATGFAAQQRTLTLEVNQRPRVDVVLSLQKMDQAIKVSGEAATLRTSDASLGEVIEPEMIHKLPLNGGHFLELSLLAPTAHMSHGAQTGESNPLYWRPGQDSAISTGGGRPNANFFLLDGSNNTDPTFNTISLSPATDDIEEFKIQTGSYSAEFGGAGGAQINVITRSGNNGYHGDVYEFLRNSAMDARSFNQPGKIPHLDQNQFGASFGGPIQRDRTFFFFNYEGLRMNDQMNMTETVPTAMERMGDFSQSGLTIYNPFSSHANPNYDPAKPVSPSNSKVIRDPFPNDAIPTSLISPVALAVMNAVPLPNLNTMGGMGGGMMNMSGPGVFGGPDSNNYLDTRSEHHVTDQYNLRVDHNFTGGDSLFARYSLSNEHGFTPQNLPGFGAYHDNRAQNLTIYHTHVLSPESVNTAWFDMNRLAMHRYSENANKNDYVSQLGIQGVGFGGPAAWGMPYFNIQGYDPIGDSILATPMNAWDTVFQVGDIMNRQVGSHSLKWGGDYRRFLWPMLGFFQNRGYYQFTPGFTSQTATNDHTGSSLADFLLGLPAVQQRQAGIPTMDMRQWYASGFIQDDWRIGPNTTLNLGLRYEFMSALHDISKPLTNLTYDNGQPFAFIGGQQGMPLGLMYPNETNFAPRLGLAQGLPQWGMVVRAGYGLFFTPVDMNTWCNQVHNPPLVFAETRQSDNYTPSLFGFNFGPASMGTTPVSMAAVDPHSPAEYVSQWSLSVQKSLPAALVMEVGYQGSRGYHLQRSHLINNALPGPGPLGPRRPIQTLSFLPGTVLPGQVSGDSFPVSGINLLENSANSWYDAGWVEVRRHSSLGITLLANYTWSKNLSDAPDFRSPMFESSIPQNNNDLAAEKGLACDVRHRAVVSLVYNLPGINGGGWVRQVTSHWEVASIYQIQSGFPFTVSVFGDTANAGTLLGENPIRANYTGQAIFPAGTQNSMEWFNPAAFAAPAAYQFGDVGRNTIEGPGMQVLDLAMTREFVLWHESHLQLRGELFNGLNHTNLGTPNRFVNTPQFGTITDAATPGREVQLSGRITF